MSASPAGGMLAHGLRPLILIYATACITVMGVSIILPVLPQMAQVFGLSKAEIGILVFSFTLPGIFLAPVGGILADRVGRKVVLVPCLLLFALGGIMSALAHSLPELVGWRFAQGCGAACLGVLYNTIIGDLYTDQTTRLKVMGFAAMSLSLGSACYPAIGGLLGEWGWRWPLALSALGIPLALHCLCTPLPAPKGAEPMPAYARTVGKLLLTPRILYHCGITLCAFIVLYGPLVTYFPMLAAETFHASSSAIGLTFGLSALGTSGAAFALQKFSHKYSSGRLALLGSCLFVLAMCLLVCGRVYPALWLYILPILCYGLGQGLTYPAVISSLSGLAPESGRGILMAANGTLLRLAQTVSPALCGAVFLWSSFEGVYVLGVCTAVCMLWLTYKAFHVSDAGH